MLDKLLEKLIGEDNVKRFKEGLDGCTERIRRLLPC